MIGEGTRETESKEFDEKVKNAKDFQELYNLVKNADYEGHERDAEGIKSKVNNQKNAIERSIADKNVVYLYDYFIDTFDLDLERINRSVEQKVNNLESRNRVYYSILGILKKYNYDALAEHS